MSPSTLHTHLLLPALALLAVPLLSCDDEDDDDTAQDTSAEDALACPEPGADAISVPEAKLYFEHNSTDEDTGLHGLFDQDGWSRLCVYDPNGQQILSVNPMGDFGGLGMASLFFESREPPHDQVSVQEHLDTYPEGTYVRLSTPYRRRTPDTPSGGAAMEAA